MTNKNIIIFKSIPAKTRLAGVLAMAVITDGSNILTVVKIQVCTAIYCVYTKFQVLTGFACKAVLLQKKLLHLELQVKSQ